MKRMARKVRDRNGKRRQYPRRLECPFALLRCYKRERLEGESNGRMDG